MQQGEPSRILGGKYRLVRQLGRGGMGSVWHAEHLTLSSPVALKLIDPATAREPGAVQRFLREARTAAALRSPHVVQILDYGVDDFTPYIAMELLEGESLAERLARMGQLSVQETVRVIQHIARAISRAHEAGIVHRDLKPENVFVVTNDGDDMIKVLDFGIVKADPGAFGTSASPATRTGAMLGTPYFMSPEQTEGVGSVDHRTDIWALGVIAYRCLLGKLPFNGDSVGRLILEICTRPLPIPSRAGPVPEGFDAWFARACARDRDARFDTAKQAAAEFARVADGPLSNPSDGTAPEDSILSRQLAATTNHNTSSEVAPRSNRRFPAARRRKLLSSAALLALVLVLGTSLLLGEWPEDSLPSDVAAAGGPAATLPPPSRATREALLPAPREHAPPAAVGSSERPAVSEASLPAQASAEPAPSLPNPTPPGSAAATSSSPRSAQTHTPPAAALEATPKPVAKPRPKPRPKSDPKPPSAVSKTGIDLGI